MILLPVALAPSDDVAAILQAAAVGGLVGSALAARQRIRNPDFDVALPPILWSLLFAVVALVVALARELSLW